MKCALCSRRLSLVETTLKCRCGQCFCFTHRMPEYHKCTYDYKKDKVKLEKIVRPKIEQI